MDVSCMVLSCVLLIQMALILIMLNPVYDVRKITRFINKTIKYHQFCYSLVIISYFLSIIYLGMFIPLHSIHKLIFGSYVEDVEKLILLRKIEKNYIITGFSLFLVVVIYGVRALVSYTACMVELTRRSNDSLNVISDGMKNGEKKNICSSLNILPNLLRAKRSISYETILFTNELRNHLKNILRNDFPRNLSVQKNVQARAI
ncbi:uncharacterized protein LOC113234683 [Hyposmocoma kahamanoa]|uniref:uncharacterized protein LOC113234683 n=1 Tax=Hyposmocoma kahamanoa TaxID=1477025 RepID=UPI000E6DA4FA|nr:uncharacterized protein LOC113234683 [Hyposmocoma kahamanoa]